ncbi:flocculation protein FLO11-like isoform X4 [Polypterus senegalus]|uniref:flocculation protein FLO11-like isoform X4 n=1 Tax=Polypterus senegalus TaxID=55291 RepID=UPI0019657244|nr:flocculation protein FLO11-like isoform X4 [Polypterus senegalus]
MGRGRAARLLPPIGLASIWSLLMLSTVTTQAVSTQCDNSTINATSTISSGVCNVTSADESPNCMSPNNTTCSADSSTASSNTFSQDISPSPTSSAFSQEVPPSPTSSIFSQDISPSPTSSAFSQEVPPSPTSSVFSQDIPPSPTSSTFSQDIPPSPTSSAFSQEVLPSTTSSAFSQHVPPSPASSVFSQDISPSPSSSVTSSAFSQHVPPSPTSSAFSQEVPPSPTSSIFSQDIPPSPTSSAFSQEVPPSPTSSAFSQDIPPSPTSSTFSQHIPPSPTSSAFSQEVLPSTTSNAFSQHVPPSPASSVFSQDISPSPSSSVTSSAFSQDVPPSTTSSAFSQHVPPSPTSSTLSQDISPSPTSSTFHQEASPSPTSSLFPSMPSSTLPPHLLSNSASPSPPSSTLLPASLSNDIFSSSPSNTVLPTPISNGTPPSLPSSTNPHSVFTSTSSPSPSSSSGPTDLSSFSTSSTAPPTVTSTLPLVAAPVVFKMNQQFKSELSNRSSPEFKVLSDQVSGELTSVYRKQFPKTFERVDILSFSNGSIITNVSIIFQTVTTAPSSSDMVRTLATGVLSNALGNLSVIADTIASNSVTLGSLPPLAVQIQMIVLTSFGTPESDNLTSIIKQQLMVILSLAYNGTIINSNVSTSNSNGWTLMTANYELNTPNIQPESVVLQQIHSNSSVNYDQTSLVVNGVNTMFSSFFYSLRITSLNFTNDLTNKGSAEFAASYSKIYSALASLFQSQSNFVQVFINNFTQGSVVANTQFIFKQNTISDAQVQQVILNGASNLTADGIVIDPASFSTFSTTTTSTSTASPNSTSSAPQATQANGTQPAAATPTSMAPANGTTQSNTTTITAAPNNHTDSASSQNNTMFTSAAPKNNSTLITMQGNITSASPPLNNSTNSTVAQHNTPTALNSTTSTSVQNNTTFTTSAANSNTTSMTAAPSNTTATGKDNTTAFTTAVPNNATSTTIQNNGTNSTATQTVATATQTVATSVTTANGTNSTATQTIATSVTTANGTNATATQTVTTSVTTATSTNSTATQTVATSVTTATSTNSTATQTVATSVTTATSTNSTATQTVATSVTTATSTNPPTTSTPSSSANSTVSLQFTIMDSFTPDLNNPASEAYKNITGRIISALDKVFIFQFKEKFNRTEIRKLSSGSIKVEADCIFNANTNVTSTEVVRSVVQGINSGVLSTLNINESTISSNNVTVRTLGPITVHIELIVLIGFSSAPQLNSILDSWLQPFLMAKYNASSVSGNYTYSDSNGWTKVVTDKVVNTTLQLPDDNVFQGLVASTSPVLYQISSVKINNFIAQSQYQTFQQSFRITNKNFDSTLSNKSSAQFMSLSQEVINTVSVLFSNQNGFQQLFINSFTPGSVVASSSFVFSSNIGSSSQQIQQTLASGISILSLSGLDIDPASLVPVTPSTPRPFPGFAVAIIVLCGLAILCFPLIIIALVKTGACRKLSHAFTLKTPSSADLRIPLWDD